LAPELKKIGSSATTSARKYFGRKYCRSCNARKTSSFSGAQRPQNKVIFRIVLRALGARTKKDWFERNNFRSQILRA